MKDGARSLRERGFTLVELLVALLIFGMLAAAGVALLRFSVDAQASARQHLDAMAAERRIESLLAGDLAQAVPRMTRNEAGDPTQAFTGEPDSFTLVRSGRANLDGEPRPDLQKVEYRIADGKLLRIPYPMLDGTPPGTPALLLGNVERAQLRYRSNEGWRERWDPIRPDLMPRAVELLLKQARSPEMRYVLLVGTGQ